MQRSKSDMWVGLFVLLGAAALLFLALKAGNLLSLQVGKTYTLQAQFQDVGGLKAKAAVKSSGVVVGRVKQIAYDDKTFQATVTLDMQEQYHFPDDSTLKILTSGLLGDQYIGVEAGASENSWKAGDTVTQTQSAVVLENLIGQFMNSMAAKSGSSNEDGSTSASGGLDSPAPAASATKPKTAGRAAPAASAAEPALLGASQ